MNTFSTDALVAHLKPIQPYLDSVDISEILVNRPQEIFIERKGQFEQVSIEALNYQHLNRLGTLIANYNQKPFDSESPRLSGILPQGARVQMIKSPILEKGKFALSIRKQVIADLTLDDFGDDFYHDVKLTFNANNKLADKTVKSDGYSKACDVKNTLKEAIIKRKTIIVSGGTSTGKTTFLNACLKEINKNERLIVLEDTREIFIKQPNYLCLLAGNKGDSNQEQDMIENLKASLRLRPDRILLGELRGGEAATFLEAASTGHEGSFTTIHASTPTLALERLCMLAERGGLRQQNREELREYIATIVDVIVQLKRSPDGKRNISEILRLSV
tara:strand:- start:16483 stop:17478 length:996 start_codon:yes stop_codon:yes gene_type:complete